MAILNSSANGAVTDGDRRRAEHATKALWDPCKYFPNESSISTSRNEADTESETHGVQQSEAEQENSGIQIGLVPVTEHEEFRELSSRERVGLEEQWEKRVGLLCRQGVRRSIAQIWPLSPHRMGTADTYEPRTTLRGALRFQKRSGQTFGKRTKKLIAEAEARVPDMLRKPEPPPPPNTNGRLPIYDENPMSSNGAKP